MTVGERDSSDDSSTLRASGAGRTHLSRLAALRLYSFAHLGGIELGVIRVRGVGLANSLFPWARCLVASSKFGLTRIAATWPQLCHRQWMRWDRDKRCYTGLFDEKQGTVSGARKLLLLATARHINEHDFLRYPEEHRDGVVVFSGMDGYFADLLDDQCLIRDALLKATRRRHRVGPGQELSRAICVHVRLGDFIPSDGALSPFGDSSFNIRQPIHWFVGIVRSLRVAIDSGVRVAIFSDGDDEELRPLLELPNCDRVCCGSSLADLLALSTAGVLVASGSTFSMWAAYLGRMPVIWPKAQRRQKLHGANWEYESEIGAGPLPEGVLTLARKRLRGW